MQIETENKQIQPRQNRLLYALLGIILFVISALGILQLGCVYSEKSWEYFVPDYAMIDIAPLLEKETLSEEDYETLYRQTGLTKVGVDRMREKGMISRILSIQDSFFRTKTRKVDHFAPFTYDEETDILASMAALEDGDIIVTSTTWFSWWRYGHAALVVDGEAGTILESIAPGRVSEFAMADSFADLADFMILRPKVSAETKAQVVAYAKQELVEIPYRLTVGIFSKKYSDGEVNASQCAHLVWQAYKRFGVDLDGTGGGVVKPRDLARSQYVEVVQAYGFDLDTLWG